MKRLWIKICCGICVFLMMGTQVEATSWEDKDVPISFQIEMLPWREVNKLIPKNEMFTIIDVETAKRFRVQRRAGSEHADVQPLTREDTAIMKEIYSGKWSWKRRSILILTKDQLIAASMHGMPHGAGALDNGFAGHFCVHFLGSITHLLKNEDFAHKLMIFKSGGKLAPYIYSLNPNDLIEAFAVAINQQDAAILSLTVNHDDKLAKVMPKIDYLDIIRIEEIKHRLLYNEISVQVHLYTHADGRSVRTLHFLVWREVNRWVIDEEGLYKQLESL